MTWKRLNIELSEVNFLISSLYWYANLIKCFPKLPYGKLCYRFQPCVTNFHPDFCSHQLLCGRWRLQRRSLWWGVRRPKRCEQRLEKAARRSLYLLWRLLLNSRVQQMQFRAILYFSQVTESLIRGCGGKCVLGPAFQLGLFCSCPHTVMANCPM